MALDPALQSDCLPFTEPILFLPKLPATVTKAHLNELLKEFERPTISFQGAKRDGSRGKSRNRSFSKSMARTARVTFANIGLGSCIFCSDSLCC
jgi:hypothetical protein